MPRKNRNKKSNKKKGKGKWVTLHLVRRPEDDPLAGKDGASEFILEPDINSEDEYNRVKRLFGNVQHVLPHWYRDDDDEPDEKVDDDPTQPRHFSPYDPMIPRSQIKPSDFLKPIREEHFQAAPGLNPKDMPTADDFDDELEINEDLDIGREIFPEDNDLDDELKELIDDDYMNALQSDDEDENGYQDGPDKILDNFMMYAMADDLKMFDELEDDDDEKYNTSDYRTYDDWVAQMKASGKYDEVIIEEVTDDEDDYINYAANFDDMSIIESEFTMKMKDYADDLIGELDDDEEGLRGDMNPEFFLQSDFKKYIKHERKKKSKKLRSKASSATSSLLEQLAIEEDEDEKDEEQIDAEIAAEFARPPREKWDVESILSTRSNLENHPKELEFGSRKLREKIKMDSRGLVVGALGREVIKEEEDEVDEVEEKIWSFGFLTPQTGVNVTVNEKKELSQNVEENEFSEADDDDDDDVVEEDEIPTRRNRRFASPEEKKQWRRQMKEERRANRARKKQLKQKFKDVEAIHNKRTVAAKHAHSSAFRLS